MANIMKYITILLMLISFNTVANDFYMPIKSVYDGDTIKTYFNELKLPAPLNQVSVRIYGIDTPESPAKSYATTGKLGRAKCVKEAELALKAKARVIEIIGDERSMTLSNFKWGKYGGRIVATVHIKCVNIAETLIKEGLAVEYFGKGKKKDWCQ